ncbi:MAG: RNA polymerase sigma factor [Anaerolineales bacterium]|jgi:RNA polymerase sigma-70 factor (ECF subfamily)
MAEPDRAQETHLVQLAQNGDEEAFGALYDQHAQAVFRFLAGNLGNSQEAEDLTTEVFLRIWKALPDYESSGTPFSAFIFRIARNMLIDRYRADGRRQPVVSIDDIGLEEVLADPEQKIPDPQEYQTLHTALQSVRSDYREVLVLRFLNDFSIEEIAELMQRSPGAIRVLQHRALAAVRKVLVLNKEKQV